ncbi:MAG TPA: NAD-dependent epimerase/dehydratase family protein [Chloroflexota bacterium]|jgi:nucleoside-diphosphate-sugar epimerase
MSPSSVLVTGATGCLGRHLVDSLVHDGLHVRALTQQSSKTNHLDQLGVEVQRGSLVEQNDLERAVQGVDTVFHLGGLVLDDRPDDTSEALWKEIERFNVEGTERLARAAASAGAQRFVFCSSVRLFGFGNQLLWDEDDPRTPSDLYSRGKAHAEAALLRVGQETGLEVVHIRPRFIYGNHDRYVMPQLVRTARRGVLPLPGGGQSIWGVVYVKDCVQALRLAAERPVAGQAFNITSGECLSLRDILTEVARALGRPLRIVSVPMPAVTALAAAVEIGARAAGRRPPLSRALLRWRLNDHHFSIARARRDLGYTPRYRLPEALREIDLKQFLAYGG